MLEIKILFDVVYQETILWQIFLRYVSKLGANKI